MSAVHQLKVVSSVFASTARGWRGSLSFRPTTQQPEQLLRLYEFEASPFCRLVREALSEMDIDVLILPCPTSGTRFRPEAVSLGGKALFPYLADPNTGRALYESADIIDYLAETYGGQMRAPRGLRRKGAIAAAFAVSLLRAVRGLKAAPSKAPEEPLILYSFESSPYSRLVRERLSELELPYVLRNTAKARWEDVGPPQIRAKFFPTLPVEGRNRLALLEREGRVQVPYLIDPNTGVAMFESEAILAYLDQTYAA
ncbi:glutathione S-transferase N-terminal domain-containing protein [Nevskia sp.]|uniref:glutathione S-transferase N-terminal domain-containing protein n=1 Tax=Nevskia sp. TaxID=1929292 RepID=UPI002600AE0A|nr:glutathione S-transferase N-terminal domain-containing protein [Nevskia sp.]